MIVSLPILIIVLVILSSAVMANYRGRVRLRFGRQIFDHSTYTWPYNGLIYLFSRVPNVPYLERPLRQPMASLNRLVTRTVMRATTTQNEAGERIGLINRIASPLLKLHGLTRKAKSADRRAYYRRKRAVTAAVVVTLCALLGWFLLPV